MAGNDHGYTESGFIGQQLFYSHYESNGIDVSGGKHKESSFPNGYVTSSLNVTSWNATSSITGSEMSQVQVVIVSIVVAFLSIVTTGGNLLVVVSIVMDKQLQTITNYFLLSLSVADFTIGIISMPLYTVYLLLNRWPDSLGEIVCDTWLSLDYTMSNASVANLLIIRVQTSPIERHSGCRIKWVKLREAIRCRMFECLLKLLITPSLLGWIHSYPVATVSNFDRYFSVTRPLTYRARRTPRRAAIQIAAAWTVSVLLWTPWIWAWPYIEGGRTVPAGKCLIQFLETNPYVTVVTAILAFYLPVLIMCVIYFKIYQATQKRHHELAYLQQASNRHRRSSGGSAMSPAIVGSRAVGAGTGGGTSGSSVLERIGPASGTLPADAGRAIVKEAREVDQVNPSCEMSPELRRELELSYKDAIETARIRQLETRKSPWQRLKAFLSSANRDVISRAVGSTRSCESDKQGNCPLEDIDDSSSNGQYTPSSLHSPLGSIRTSTLFRNLPFSASGHSRRLNLGSMKRGFSDAPSTFRIFGRGAPRDGSGDNVISSPERNSPGGYGFGDLREKQEDPRGMLCCNRIPATISVDHNLVSTPQTMSLYSLTPVTPMTLVLETSGLTNSAEETENSTRSVSDANDIENHFYSKNHSANVLGILSEKSCNIPELSAESKLTTSLPGIECDIQNESSEIYRKMDNGKPDFNNISSDAIDRYDGSQNRGEQLLDKRIHQSYQDISRKNVRNENEKCVNMNKAELRGSCKRHHIDATKEIIWRNIDLDNRKKLIISEVPYTCEYDVFRFRKSPTLKAPCSLRFENNEPTSTATDDNCLILGPRSMVYNTQPDKLSKNVFLSFKTEESVLGPELKTCPHAICEQSTSDKIVSERPSTISDLGLGRNQCRSSSAVSHLATTNPSSSIGESSSIPLASSSRERFSRNCLQFSSFSNFTAATEPISGYGGTRTEGSGSVRRHCKSNSCTFECNHSINTESDVTRQRTRDVTTSQHTILKQSQPTGILQVSDDSCTSGTKILIAAETKDNKSDVSSGGIQNDNTIEPSGFKEGAEKANGPSSTSRPSGCEEITAGVSDKETANILQQRSNDSDSAASVTARYNSGSSRNRGTMVSVNSSMGPMTSSSASAAAARAQTKRQEKRQEKKAARTLSAILFAFLVTWTPYNVFVLINAFWPNTIKDDLFNFGYWLCYLNSTVNPVCYALCNANFRRTYWRILTCRWFARRRHVATTVSTSSRTTKVTTISR